MHRPSERKVSISAFPLRTERALGAELSHHLGYVAGAAKPEVATNPTER